MDFRRVFSLLEICFSSLTSKLFYFLTHTRKGIFIIACEATVNHLITTESSLQYWEKDEQGLVRADLSI